MSIDPQKFENPNTYINYLANYENSIKFLDVLNLNLGFYSRIITILLKFHLRKRLVKKRNLSVEII